MKCAAVTIFAAAIYWASVQPIWAKVAVTEERVVHSFGQGTDGQDPDAGLITLNDTLLGATGNGGTFGKGTIFMLDPKNGEESILYSFCSQENCADGWEPGAGPLDVNGVLYGTTAFGGAYGYGTLFALDATTGVEKVLYSFCSQLECTDGQNPNSALVEVNGVLYGTTQFGGTGQGGTIFALDPNTGSETVLFSFGRGYTGEQPISDMINVRGTLYGTTQIGGGSGNAGGTVFSFNLQTDQESEVYTFCPPECPDGDEPTTSVIDVMGVLYGMTSAGGAHNGGTIFDLVPNTGKETVLYSFCVHRRFCPNGQYPVAGLTDVKGIMYGTTRSGGRHTKGTAFAFDTTTGEETVLYSFDGAHGAYPNSRLVNLRGTLYGTTSGGGAYGVGTVFAVKP